MSKTLKIVFVDNIALTAWHKEGLCITRKIFYDVNKPGLSSNGFLILRFLISILPVTAEIYVSNLFNASACTES